MLENMSALKVLPRLIGNGDIKRTYHTIPASSMWSNLSEDNRQSIDMKGSVGSEIFAPNVHNRNVNTVRRAKGMDIPNRPPAQYWEAQSFQHLIPEYKWTSDVQGEAFLLVT